jgi:hypothetical protein
MIYSRTLTPLCSLLATAVLSLAQTPAPKPATTPAPGEAWDQFAPPEPPEPPKPVRGPRFFGKTPRPAKVPRAPMAQWDLIEPMVPMTPMPAMAPMPPMPPMRMDMDFEFQHDFDFKAPRALAFAYQGGVAGGVAGGVGIKGRNMSDDRLYQTGQSLLDSKQWEQAVDAFSLVVSRGGARADGALYWKAYGLKKLGKRDDALAAIAELRKSYASSRWLDDAKALELEVRQASGQTVSPESESDDDLKLMALNGIMQSDPERAFPLLENWIKGSASPKLRQRAVYVLAQSSSPKAQQMLEQIARGSGNPDLQLRAISYMSERRKANTTQILAEIYASSNDLQVKRQILNAYEQSRDKDRLLQVARTEKAPELRSLAINYLGNINGQPELWQLYQSETTAEGKQQILQHMHNNGNADKLLEVVRTEKDPKLRRVAIQVLASQRTGATADALAAIYASEQDPQVKQSILDSFHSQQNAKALIDMARAEKDPKLKLRIVERISNMAGRSKEAADYLAELLK